MSNSVALMQGERETGADVRSQNVTAAMAIANIVKTSLGPIGLDKMLVDDIGEVTITNDGATILKQLEVEHPAAKVLAESPTRRTKRSATARRALSSSRPSCSSARTSSSRTRSTRRRS